MLVKNLRIANKTLWIKTISFKRIGKQIYIVRITDLDDLIWKRLLNHIRRHQCLVTVMKTSEIVDSVQSLNTNEKVEKVVLQDEKKIT